jgi:predicted dehydrogenase
VSAGKEPTRIGVVGCGTIAYWTHLRVLARMPNVRLIAAADPDREARARAAALVKTEFHEHAEELLARPDVDAVVLCPATPAHAEVALAACRRRIPFYIEKPLATSAAEARAILDARDEAGVVAAVGFNRRHHPVFERARTLLASGRIGRVRSVLSAFCEPVAPGAMAEWKQHRATGGGVLLDLASHHIDLVRWLLDDEIATVEARLESDASEDDSAWLRLATRGATEVRSTFSAPAKSFCFCRKPASARR